MSPIRQYFFFSNKMFSLLEREIFQDGDVQRMKTEQM